MNEDKIDELIVIFDDIGNGVIYPTLFDGHEFELPEDKDFSSDFCMKTFYTKEEFYKYLEERDCNTFMKFS